MSTRKLCGLCACLTLTAAVGCADAHNTFRAQSPAGPDRVQPAGGFHGDTTGGVQQVGFANWDCLKDQCPPPCDACPEPCECKPECKLPSCNLCQGKGCHQCKGGAWYPTHHHWFDYDPPRHLTYPAANVPPAVVVYPYYTHKGPDDFFKAH